MSASLLTRVAARVELTSRVAAQGLIQGRGKSTIKGSGEDFDDLKQYQPGDRVSDIDWKATARSSEPLIRRFDEHRVRHIQIVADTSAAMAATAADGTSKADALVTAAGVICTLAQRSGDLVGLVTGSVDAPRQLPQRASDGHLELLLRTIQHLAVPGGAPSDSGWLLDRAFRMTRHPTLMIVITDEAHPTTHDYGPLRRLTTRHDVVVVRIGDADPLLADDLDVDVIDAAAPRELSERARTSKGVRAEVERFRQSRRETISGMLDSLHVSQLLTAGDSTVVDDMIALLRRREAHLDV